MEESRSLQPNLSGREDRRHEKWREKGINGGVQERIGGEVRGPGSGPETGIRPETGSRPEERKGDKISRPQENRGVAGNWPETGIRPEQGECGDTGIP